MARQPKHYPELIADQGVPEMVFTIRLRRLRECELERNKKTVTAFYDLMFNQCRPAEAIEQLAGSARGPLQLDRVQRIVKSNFLSICNSLD
jgi:hypothetical protein